MKTQPKKQEHTPTPYSIMTSAKYDENSKRSGWQFLIGNESLPGYVAGIDCGNKDIGFEQEQANAEFIVQACNAHDELVTTLKDLIDIAEATHGAQERVARAKHALAKAEGN